MYMAIAERRWRFAAQESHGDSPGSVDQLLGHIAAEIAYHFLPVCLETPGTLMSIVNDVFEAAKHSHILLTSSLPCPLQHLLGEHRSSQSTHYLGFGDSRETNAQHLLYPCCHPHVLGNAASNHKL